jgi:hypothetical protein
MEGMSQGAVHANTVQARRKTRIMDISESYHLLMELGMQDPVMQHCLRTLQGMCLSQGIHIGKKDDSSIIGSAAGSQKGTTSTEAFQHHMDKYFIPFCMEAIRYFFVCGFVPWHVRRLQSTGDLVPELLPMGTFTWHVELRSEKLNRKAKQDRSPQEGFATSYVPGIISRRSGNGWQNKTRTEDKWNGKWKEENKMHAVFAGYEEERNAYHNTVVEFKKETGHPQGSRSVREDKETQYVQYRVIMGTGGLSEEEIFIYDFVPPNFNICGNSMLYATIASPMAHLLIDYKNLRQAQIRRAHAGKLYYLSLLSF